MSSQLDRRITQIVQRVVDEAPLPPAMPDPGLGRRARFASVPNWVAAVAAAAVIALAVVVPTWLLGTDGPDVGSDDVPPPPETAEPVDDVAVAPGGTDATVGVTVQGVTGHTGHELAGVLYAGGELTDLDADALGGFWAVIDDADFTTTEVLRTPADDYLGRFPFVTDTALTVEPGTYTLVVWVDHSLGGFDRWVPVNSDGRGLYGCHHTFDVAGDTETAITIPANLEPDGWNVECTTGAVTPGTDAAAAVAPPDVTRMDTTMPPASGVAAGQTVAVTVSGVSGRTGDEFAVVMYEGSDLAELEDEALGGFWAVISSDDESLTEIIRQPGDFGVGWFPYVTDNALTVEPGTYTLVLWVDETLTPSSRWVPVNSYRPGDPLVEGQDLYSCHMTFEVGTDLQTDVTVPADLHHNGWNVDCVTGAVTPGTDAAAAVAPPEDMWVEDVWADLPDAMDPVTGVDAGPTVGVTVEGVTGHTGHELAGVLYAGGELTDLDADALGGFWAVIDDADFTTTEVLRTPADDYLGRFPFVTDTDLTLEPGTYTLVVWVDHSLGGFERWVPVNSDGRGLYGCHHTFDVTGDTETAITIPANLEPDGWNVECTTGAVTPGTDAAAAVAP